MASYLYLARCDHGNCVLKAVLRSGKDLRRPVDSLSLAVATNQRHGNCVLRAGLRAGDALLRPVDSLFLAADHSFLEVPV